MKSWLKILLVLGVVFGPSRVGFAFEGDWYQPGVQEAKKAYLMAKEQANTQRVQVLTAFLSGRILKEDQDLDQARKVRNVKNMMTAKKGRALYDEALTALREEGDFDCPESTRKELREQLNEMKRVKQEADAQMNAEVNPLREKLIQIITAQTAEAGQDLSEAEMDAQVELLLASNDEPPEVVEDAVAPVAPGEPPVKEVEIYGVSDEEYEGPWMEVGRWTGDIHSMLILDLRVCDRDTDWVDSKADFMTGRVSSFRYEPAFTLPSGHEYVWRLKSIEDHSGVDVLYWPTARNKYVLQFRTRRASVYPAKQGFVLEAACPDENITKLLGTVKKATTPAPQKIRIQMLEISVQTEPRGAYVLVDGKKAKDRYGAVCKTPCKALMTPGTHEVTLQLKHFEDKTAPAFTARHGASITWRFTPSKDLDWKEFEIEAGKGWKKTSVKVWEGQSFLVQAAGQWVCGARGDLCGPQGYVPTKQPHYYRGSTQLKKYTQANYGALLMRIGEIGQTNYFGQHLLWKPDWEDQGSIYFDVNEADDRALRKGNRGRLKVRIAVLPDE